MRMHTEYYLHEQVEMKLLRAPNFLHVRAHEFRGSFRKCDKIGRGENIRTCVSFDNESTWRLFSDTCIFS